MEFPEASVKLFLRIHFTLALLKDHDQKITTIAIPATPVTVDWGLHFL